MRKQFLGTCLAAGLAVAAFGACGDDDPAVVFDSGPVFDADTTDADDTDATPPKPFCADPIDGLDPACPEGGEVRMERVIGQTEYRVTSYLKSAQDDDATTPLIIPAAGIPSCFVCDPASNMWACKQATNRVYEQAGQLTISDGVGTDIVVDHCDQGTFAMGAYLLGECDTGVGATGIAVDAFGRTHPDGAYIDYAQFAGTAAAPADNLLTFDFAGEAGGYPASSFDVYIAPDFTSTPSTTGVVNFDDNADLAITVTMPAATNMPTGTSLLMNVTFIDTPPTTGEGPPVVCLLGAINAGGAEQTFTIPAATVQDLIHTDGVMLRGAISHVLAEYDDGTIDERRIDQVGMNCYSQPFAKN